MKKTVTIREIKALKSGTGKTGKPWTLSLVNTDGDIPHFTSFNGSKFQVGTTIDVNVELKENGKFQDSWSEIYISKNGSNANSDLIEVVRKLEARVAKLESRFVDYDDKDIPVINGEQDEDAQDSTF